MITVSTYTLYKPRVEVPIKTQKHKETLIDILQQ